MTFLFDVDIENVSNGKKYPKMDWATKHILCHTNTAMKSGMKHKDALQTGLKNNDWIINHKFKLW